MHGENEKSFIKRIFDIHNQVRYKHGAPLLLFSPELCITAQEHADRLEFGRGCDIDSELARLQHSDNHDFGENLAFFQSGCKFPDNIAGQVMEKWTKHMSNTAIVSNLSIDS